jgi:hypothetical protein
MWGAAAPLRARSPPHLTFVKNLLDYHLKLLFTQAIILRRVFSKSTSLRIKPQGHAIKKPQKIDHTGRKMYTPDVVNLIASKN